MWDKSIPAQRPTSLILNNPRLKEVLLLAQVHNLAHPGEGVLGAWVLLFQTQLRTAAVGDEVQVFFHGGGVHAEDAAGHGVAGVLDFQLCAFEDHLDHFLLEAGGPEVGVFQFDLVDYVYTKVQVHGFVAQNVLELLGDAGHFVAAAHGQDLAEATVEEDAFGNYIEGHQVAQQFLIGFWGAGGEGGVAQGLGVLKAPGGFVGHAGQLAVHVENFAFVHAQGFNAVLVGVGVDCLFE